jgi:hypothetical protein
MFDKGNRGTNKMRAWFLRRLRDGSKALTLSATRSMLGQHLALSFEKTVSTISLFLVSRKMQKREGRQTT